MKRFTILLMLATTVWGCSGAKPRPTTDNPASAAAPSGHSEILITYTLGHAHRKFVATADDTKIHGETYLDRTLLKQNAIEPAKYQSFLQRVAEFVDKGRVPASQAAAVSEEECRNPYTITVIQAQETKKISGCRTANDEGTFGKIIRDGEFLLFGS
jgi:hypothetical protein